jgi:hypothetical protein
LPRALQGRPSLSLPSRERGVNIRQPESPEGFLSILEWFARDLAVLDHAARRLVLKADMFGELAQVDPWLGFNGMWGWRGCYVGFGHAAVPRVQTLGDTGERRRGALMLMLRLDRYVEKPLLPFPEINITSCRAEIIHVSAIFFIRIESRLFS